ncbi:helix-turn-helix domain-containing protein [Nocardioides pantholopis]|uniref:helix-turn-helix domain-containing protein n=1 Tax=Nocardioides pantholopis TaxID=2483798 RepID=UPI0019D18287|nr:AraC family transcriptional regulator [Nocardioides pantholopis]
MAAVPAPLAPYVTSVVAYDVRSGAPGTHRGLPSGSLTLVLPVGDPLDVGWSGAPQSRARHWSTLAGLSSRAAQIHHGGTQVGVQLALSPAGARALLGVPAAALAGEIVELPDVVPALAHLPEQLAETPAARRAGVVLRALARVGRSELRPRADVGLALAQLTRGVPVGAVAEEVGLSRRHLTTLVRAECGLAPKELQRVSRLEASRDALRAGRRLADVAAVCGYADQAHLTRDWTALAGCTPTTWLREEFPFVQDLGGGVGAESGP